MSIFTAEIGALGIYILTAADVEAINAPSLTNVIPGAPVVEGQGCAAQIVAANGSNWNIAVQPDGGVPPYWVPNVPIGTGEGELQLL